MKNVCVTTRFFYFITQINNKLYSCKLRMGAQYPDLASSTLPTLNKSLYYLGASVQIFVKLIIISAIFFYICKCFKMFGMIIDLLLVNFIMGRGKTVKRHHSPYSYLDSWWSSGDLTKDLITQKNTLLNSKVGQYNPTSLNGGNLSLKRLMFAFLDNSKRNSGNKSSKRVSFNE